MVEAVKCPTEDELVRLNEDKLSEERTEALLDHIEQCESCAGFFGDLEDPEDDLGKRLAQIKSEDLDRARLAIEEDTLRETATSIWGKVSPLLESRQTEPSLKIPCQLGQYEVTRLIDFGGMGEVYEANHVRLKRPVAIKVILGYRQDDPATHHHFLREMETAGQLEHPNLVRAYDAWEHEGCLFLAQELLVGDSLQNLVNRGEFGGPTEIVDALLGTCRALEQLHEKNFIHRDVKPANIMRLEDGTIKLIDYGLAVAADTRRSAIRVGAGTMGYMSPEQAHGGHPIDQRSDIYAAGRVLKYLISKQPEKPKRKRDVQIIEHLDTLAERMTQMDPKDRFQNVYAVIVQLEKLKNEAELAQISRAGNQQASSSRTERVDSNSAKPEDKARAKPKQKAALKVERTRQKPESSQSAANPALPKPSAVQETRKKLTEPKVSVRTQPGAKRKTRPVGIWTIVLPIVALLILAVGYGAYELVFKTDRETTVLVQNHQPGDVLQIKSDDGQVRSVELGDESKFVVGPGTYTLSLEEPGNRRLNPGNIRVTGRDRLTVRIEDVPTRPAEEPVASAKEPPEKAAAETPMDLVVPVSSAQLLTARKTQSRELGLPETLTVSLPNAPDFKMEFVLIPSGTFQMGVTESLASTKATESKWYSASQPAHPVRITKPFYMSRYEVTQKQFRAIFGGGLTPVDGDGTRYPATQVGWQPCVDFCSRLTDVGTNIPDGATVRLPTEAEWEYACRAGTDTWYWMGNTIGPDQASLRLRGRDMKLEPIDAYEPNPFGLYHMHGNVMEWCLDWLSDDYYGSSPANDPQGPASGTEKILRGGGLSNPPFAATSFWRQGYKPDARGSSIGFRPVIELPDAD